jgi:hypothetical protein
MPLPLLFGAIPVAPLWAAVDDARGQHPNWGH